MSHSALFRKSAAAKMNSAPFVRLYGRAFQDACAASVKKFCLKNIPPGGFLEMKTYIKI